MKYKKCLLKLFVVCLLLVSLSACGSTGLSSVDSPKTEGSELDSGKNTKSVVKKENVVSDDQEEEPAEEDVIIQKSEELGDVQDLTIKDYDGDGSKEAFGVLVTGEEFSGCRTIRGICFIDSAGNDTVFDFGYGEDDDCYYYQDQKNTYINIDGYGLFHGEFGGMGSGSMSFLFGVRDRKPYELKVSRKIERFGEKNDKYVYYRIVDNPPDPEFTANYKEEVELQFDAQTGEFELGDPTGRVYLGGEDVTEEYFSYFEKLSLGDILAKHEGEWFWDADRGGCIGIKPVTEQGDLLDEEVRSKAKWVIWFTGGDVLTDLDVYEYDEKKVKLKSPYGEYYYMLDFSDDSQVVYCFGTKDGSYDERVAGY